MGLGHELWFTLANAQAHGSRGVSHEGVAHLTDDPEETPNLPVRDLARAGSPAPTCSPITVNDSSQSGNSAGTRQLAHRSSCVTLGKVLSLSGLQSLSSTVRSWMKSSLKPCVPPKCYAA